MLSNIFEEYIKVNKQYVDFVNELLNKDFTNFKEDEIVNKLVDGKMKFEKLMNDTDICEKEEEEGLFLKGTLKKTLFFLLELSAKAVYS